MYQVSNYKFHLPVILVLRCFKDITSRLPIVTQRITWGMRKWPWQRKESNRYHNLPDKHGLQSKPWWATETTDTQIILTRTHSYPNIPHLLFLQQIPPNSYIPKVRFQVILATQLVYKFSPCPDIHISVYPKTSPRLTPASKLH